MESLKVSPRLTDQYLKYLPKLYVTIQMIEPMAVLGWRCQQSEPAFGGVLIVILQTTKHLYPFLHGVQIDL